MSNCIICAYQPYIYKYAWLLSKNEKYVISLVETNSNTIDWKNHYFPKAKSYDFFEILNYYHRKDIKLKKTPKYILEDINVQTMIERNLIHSYKSNNLKNKIINSYYFYWEKVFKEIKPKYLIFEEVPHQLVHYICYLIAKNKKINIQMFNRTFDSEKRSLGVIWQKTFDENYKIINPKHLKQYESRPLSSKKMKFLKEISISDHKTLIKINLPDQKLLNDKNEQPKYKILYKKLSSLFIKFSYLSKLPQQDIITNIKIPSIINPYLAFILRKAGGIKKKINYFYYKNKTSTDFLFNGKKNIVLLLQYQPEASTSPLGGVFCDQIKLIKFIQKKINNDFNLIVKEHPSQFSPDYSRYYERVRSINFYKKIISFKNTFLAPLYFDIFSLPKNSIYISITGTVILECALRGLPAICLGCKWFDQIPTIYNIKSYKQLIRLFENLDLVNKKANQKKAQDYIKNLISFIDNEEILGGKISRYPENISYYEQKGLKLYQVYKNCKVLY